MPMVFLEELKTKKKIYCTLALDFTLSCFQFVVFLSSLFNSFLLTLSWGHFYHLNTKFFYSLKIFF